MSTFCTGVTTQSIPTHSVSELQAIYSNADGKPGILPDSMPTMTDGLASSSWLSTYMTTLKNNGILPSLPETAPESSDSLKPYITKENTLQDSIKKEYCFYESRYFAALNMFLTAVASDTSAIQGYLDKTRALNNKLTLLTQITNEIAKKRYSDTKTLQSSINSLNTELQSKQTKLLEQKTVLEKETAAADLHKRMVEYTTEKNRANQNLLTLYGILNVSALAMIFYIARS